MATVGKNIPGFMEGVMKRYKDVLKRKACDEFWDLIVLTTFDEEQKKVFEQLIQYRLDTGFLLPTPMIVVADPPGVKLGSGGSTLYVLNTLIEKYGKKELFSKRLLIIHSGGSSQRLPSNSILGKIFSPVPCQWLLEASSTSVPTMLEVKLAMYLPFLDLMPKTGGVFIACADDIEVYNFDINDIDREQLASSDIVALAHPSSVSIGTRHGVYVLDQKTWEGKACLLHCTDYMQKAPEEIIRQSGAIFTAEDGSELVYTDSVYWMTPALCEELLTWYEGIPVPQPVDIDAYTDFLTAIGVHESKKAWHTPDSSIGHRQSLRELLVHKKLLVMAMPESKFHHLGTMPEYLHHLVLPSVFGYEMGIASIQYGGGVSIIQSFLKDKDYVTLTVDEVNDKREPTAFTFKDGVVIEFCYIETPIEIHGGNTIISNCVIATSDGVKRTIAGGVLYHTAPIKFQGKSLFITIAFDTDAVMKSSASADNLTEMIVLRKPLDEILQLLKLSVADVKPDDSALEFSLWKLRLFAAAQTAAQSFWLTEQLVATAKAGKAAAASPGAVGRRFSMADVIDMKDLKSFLSYRDQLLRKIADK